MKKNRKNKTMLLALLVVAITSMTIVFAAMSTTLKIKGAGLVSTDAWNIKFENLASVTLKGAAQETTAPTIKSDTEIGDYVVVLKRTGDEVVYNFDIHNYGKLNAKIEELNIQTPVCTGNAEDEAQKIADAQIVSESLTYTLTYSDGEEVKVGDTLKAEEVKNLTLKLAYTGESMPSESVQITGLSVSIKYAQDMSEPEIPVEPVDPETIAGKRFDKETKVMIDDKVVTIPAGATISGATGEYESVDNGLVMYIIPEGVEITDWSEDKNNNKMIDVQEQYDQFVWIPVENAILDLSDDVEALSSTDNVKAAVQNEIDAGRYPMAIKKNESDYFGVLYDFKYDSEKFSVNVTPNFNSRNDPCKIRIFGREEQLTEIYDTLYSDFNNAVENISNDKGFWVGRYETSGYNDECVASKRNIPLSWGAIAISKTRAYWDVAYTTQKSYSSKKSLSSNSSMILGCQWDQIMIWMKDVKNPSGTNSDAYYVLNGKSFGRYGGGTHGSNTEWTGRHVVRNIYDLAGNLDEMTTESDPNNNNSYYTVRGGNYYTSGTFADYSPAGRAQYGCAKDTRNETGSRMVLY